MEEIAQEWHKRDEGSDDAEAESRIKRRRGPRHKELIADGSDAVINNGDARLGIDYFLRV